MPRLSVNISDETAESIRRLTSDKSTTATDIVRRATGVFKYLDGAQRDGDRIQLVEPHICGEKVTEVRLI